MQDHHNVQMIILGKSADELGLVLEDARFRLNFLSFKLRNQMEYGPAERHEATYNIEIIVQAESLLGHGGWFYRFFRRIRLTNTYFKPRA